VLLPGLEPEEAFLLLEKARAAAEAWAGGPAPFTVSIGVASLPKDGRRGPELLRKADAGLFRAKKLGRNRVCFPPDEPMVAKTSHYTQTQLEWLSRLAKERGVGEAELLREAVDDFLFKHRR
jgi:predicted signal transduction protein with EAL and GGDEF domain